MNCLGRTAGVSLGQESRRHVARWFRSIWDHALFVFGFLIPLSIAVFGREGTLLVKIPPIVPVTAVFLLVAGGKGGLRRVVSTWRASPVVLWLYVLVCGVEAVLMVYHRNPNGWFYLGGRAMFLAVLLVVAALCDGLGAARDCLVGMACGAVVIALLSVLHASGIVYLPFATPLWPVRTFGPLRMPLPRTVGLDMTPDKFGILASVALATAMARAHDGRWLLPWPWFRAVLVASVVLAALITQTRGVYLTVLWAIGLGALLVLAGKQAADRLDRARVAWVLAIAFAASLVVANIAFPFIAPDWLVDVGGQESVDGVLTRLGANATGWLVLRRFPVAGIGHGRFRAVSGFRTGIHNHFWEHIVATGIVGGLPYILFHLLILVHALRLLGSSTGAIYRAVALVLVVSVSATYVAYQFFPGFFTSVFAAVCGLVVSVRREEQAISKLMVPQVVEPLRGIS